MEEDRNTASRIEYEQEALCLRNWRNYLATLTTEDAHYCMIAAVESFDDFACEAASRLGPFTEGVNRLQSQLTKSVRGSFPLPFA